MGDYTKYEFAVVEAGAARTVTLQIDVSPEESEYVTLSVTVPPSYESVSFEPDTAVELADALDQRAPIEAPGLDDYDDSHAELRVSWDDEGADLLFMLTNRSVRLIIDYDEDPVQIAEALRACAAELVAAAE